jgi:hypothetical protein
MRDESVDPQEATAEFFRTVLAKADRERFIELLDKDDDDDDEDAVIDLSQMDAIQDWILGHFTGKLQSSSNSSSPGANGTGPAPKSVSLQSPTTTA